MNGPFFVRRDVTTHLLTPERVWGDPDWKTTLEACGLDQNDFKSRFLDKTLPDGSVLIYIGWGDLRHKRYRHRKTAQPFVVDVAGFPNNLIALSPEELEIVSHQRKLDGEDFVRLGAAVHTLSDNAEYVGAPSGQCLFEELTLLFSRVPVNTRCFIVDADEHVMLDDRSLQESPTAIKYNQTLRQAVAAHREKRNNVSIVHLKDCLHDGSDRQPHMHYDRIVYFRIAQAVFACLDAAVTQASCNPR